MSIKEAFTDDEWFLLSSTPAMIGAAMSSAAPSGVVGTVKELTASMRGSVAGLQDYPDSDLVAQLLQKAENWDEAKDKMKDYRERIKARLQNSGVTSREQLHDNVIADCRAAAGLVDTKCSEEDARIYREWCVKIANLVAEAAKEGGFLGFGGERISQEERAMLTRIEEALGVPVGNLMA
ncbi:MAG: hypothetical protein V3U76_07495 [Granulosicoccus sp.]